MNTSIGGVEERKIPDEWVEAAARALHKVVVYPEAEVARSQHWVLWADSYREHARAALAALPPGVLDAAEAVQRVRAIHQQRTTTVYAAHHHDLLHTSEDERCTDACFEPWTLCNGDGSAWPCTTIRALDS